MRNQSQFYLGIVVILLGIGLLLANIFNIDIGLFCWPLFFILLGIFLIVRPRMVDRHTTITQKFLGEVERRGAWSVVDEEFWDFVAEVDLDMTEAIIPAGETRIRVWGFVSDINLTVPKHVGVTIVSTALVSEVAAWGHKEEAFLTAVRQQSDNYKLAEQKIRLESSCLVGDITVRHV